MSLRKVFDLSGFVRIALLLTALILGATLFRPSKAGAQLGLQPAEQLSIFDGQGKRVGNVIGLTPFLPLVGFKVAGIMVVLSVDSMRFSAAGGAGGTAEIGLLFQSADCPGTPFSEALGTIGPFPFVLLNGSKLYTLSGSPETIFVNSSFSGSTCAPLQGETIAAPVRFVADLSAQFQPPFRVR